MNSRTLAQGSRALTDYALRVAFNNRYAAGAILLKLTGAFFSFLVIFTVARTGGAAVTGDYAMAIATSNLAALVATFGLDQITVRTLGGDLRQGHPEQARAALRAVVRFVAPLAVVSAGLMMAFSRFAPEIGATTTTMAYAAFSVPAFALWRIAVMTLRASGSVLWSQFVDGLAHSALILVFVGATLLSGRTVTSQWLAMLYSFSLTTVTAIAWLTVVPRIRAWPKGGTVKAGLVFSGWPILATALFQMLTAWLIMAQMGAQVGVAHVGAYRVANQVVIIVALMSTTIETLYNPQFAGDFRTGDYRGAWARHRRASGMMLAAALLPIVLCIGFPKLVLGLFGPDFVLGWPVLVILTLGQVTNILTGPIGGFMIMSGHERLSLKLSVTSMLIGLGLSFFLIPSLGVMGGAIASGSATAFRNLTAYGLMRRRFPIR